MRGARRPEVPRQGCPGCLWQGPDILCAFGEWPELLLGLRARAVLREETGCVRGSSAGAIPVLRKLLPAAGLDFSAPPNLPLSPQGFGQVPVHQGSCRSQAVWQ